MPDETTIANQVSLLAAHRRTLAVYLRQQAALGAAHVPPGVANGIDDERAQIRRIKQALRGWGQLVEDHPDDEPPAVFPSRPPLLRVPPWLRTVGVVGLLGAVVGLLLLVLVQNRPATDGAPTQSASTLPSTSAGAAAAPTPAPPAPTGLPTSAATAPPLATLTPALAVVVNQPPECGLPAAAPPAPAPGAERPTLRIALACAGDVITATAHLPRLPMPPSAFLAEPAELTLTLGAVYALPWLDALAAYAVGNDQRALDRLDEIRAFVDGPAALLLRAQVLMHLAEWEPARDAYGALAMHPQASVAEQAQAHAGIGLAYILAAQSTGFQSPSARNGCREYAYAEFDRAIELAPAQARWWLGRALARIKCVSAHDVAAIGADVAQAQALLATATPDEQALAESMAALVALDFQEDQNLPSVDKHARQALQLAPWQAMPYHLLSCVADRRGEGAEALRRYHEYQARLLWEWEQRQAADNLARGAYCVI